MISTATATRTDELLYPPLRKQCQGRPCYTIEEAMTRAVMSQHCPRCGWFHVLREFHTPETAGPPLRQR